MRLVWAKRSWVRISSSALAARGSNQAVAAGRLDADVTFMTRLGRDPFAEMARATWLEAGVKPAVIETAESYTGAAYIFVEETTGNNAIIVCPGAAALISPADIDAWNDVIAGAGVFVTQLEQPIQAAHRALEIARASGTVTILNPAPAASLPRRNLSADRLSDAKRNRGGSAVPVSRSTISKARDGRQTCFWERASARLS